MTFASPIWLLGLGPWAAMALWLIVGMRQRRPTPFLQLWKTAEPLPKSRRRIQFPPAALVCLIAAALAAVLSAAEPRLGKAAASHVNVLVIVDRGITMSDPGRFSQVMHSAHEALHGPFDPAQVHYLNVPTHAQGDWAAARQWPATALNTQPLLHAAAVRALDEYPLVLVLSDQNIQLDHPHLVQCAPSDPIEDVAITQISAAPRSTDNAAGQVMVRLLNHSRRPAIDIEIHTAGQTTLQTLPLPPAGQQANAFINLPQLGPAVEARLRTTDSIPLDDAAFLVRQGSVVKIQPLFQLPAELQRMVEIYQRRQPAADPDLTLLISRDVESLPQGALGVVLPESNTPAAEPVKPAGHPITAQVQWERWPWKLSTASSPPGWTPLVTAGPKIALAFTPHPVRRVWVGLSSDKFARSPQFVMFWTDVLDWLAGAQPHYAAQTVHQLSNDWKCVTSQDPNQLPPGLRPGLWASNENTLALNADSFTLPSPPARHEQAKWARAIRPDSAGRLDGVGPLILIAFVLLALAASLSGRLRAASSSHW